MTTPAPPGHHPHPSQQQQPQQQHQRSSSSSGGGHHHQQQQQHHNVRMDRYPPVPITSRSSPLTPHQQHPMFDPHHRLPVPGHEQQQHHNSSSSTSSASSSYPPPPPGHHMPGWFNPVTMLNVNPGGHPPPGSRSTSSHGQQQQQQSLRTSDDHRDSSRERMVSVSLPTSMTGVYSPYSTLSGSSSGQTPSSLSHLPPHVQVSMIQAAAAAERERMERSMAAASRYNQEAAGHERLMAARSGSSGPGRPQEYNIPPGMSSASYLHHQQQLQQQQLQHQQQQQQHSPATGHHGPPPPSLPPGIGGSHPGAPPPPHPLMFGPSNYAFLAAHAAAQQPPAPQTGAGGHHQSSGHHQQQQSSSSVSREQAPPSHHQQQQQQQQQPHHSQQSLHHHRTSQQQPPPHQQQPGQGGPGSGRQMLWFSALNFAPGSGGSQKGGGQPPVMGPRDGPSAVALHGGQSSSSHGQGSSSRSGSLSDHRIGHHHQPLQLLIPVDKRPLYVPEVEAISPTLPDEDLREDMSPFKSTKEELLNNINRIDREISQAENQISKLKRKQKELEDAASRARDGLDDKLDGGSSADSRSQQLSVAQLVYSENRNKAAKAHSILDHLIPQQLRTNLGIPLYNQPSDTVIYHENMKKFKVIKSKLIEKLKEKSNEKSARESYLTKNYDNLMKEWLKKLESKSLDNKSKSKDNKMREFFEKQFPELKKAREDKERLSRAGQRIGARSEADIEEIMDNLQEAELEDKKMKSYAVIPPIMRDKSMKRYLFVNTNGKIDDPLTEYKERSSLVKISWTDEEKEIFREKYILYPKNFGLISTYLDRKTVCDCVQYYYLSKKSENYRHLIRKHAKKRTRALVKAQAAAAAAQVNSNNGGNGGNGNGGASGRTSGRGKGGNNNSNNNNSNNNNSSNQTAATDGGGDNEGSAMDTSVTTNAVVSISDINDNSSSRLIVPGMGGNAADDGSRDQNNICCLCKSSISNIAKSRIVTKANCHLYGLRSDDPLFDNFENTPPNVSTKENADHNMNEDMNEIYHRICFECRCKHVRRHCPVQSCKTADGKDKRLKALPQQWFELPEVTRSKYASELDDFPLDVKKACLRCVMRVSRRIGAVSPKTVMKVLTTRNHRRDSMSSGGANGLLWTEEEMKMFEACFKEHKKNWNAISSAIKSKSVNDCKRFYYNFKYKLNLKPLSGPAGGGDGTRNQGESSEDSDEYWKGFTDDSEETSSADEANASDTASASSPPRNAPFTSSGVSVATSVEGRHLGQDLRSLSQGSLKSNDGNDSSATLSADEKDDHLNPNSNSLRTISPASAQRPGASGQTITITPLSIAHATIDRHYRNIPTNVSNSTSSTTSLPEGFMSRGRPSVISSAASNDMIVMGHHRPPPVEGLMASRAPTEGLMSQRLPQTPSSAPPQPTQKFPSFLINPNAPTTGVNMNRSSSSSAMIRAGQLNSNNLSPSIVNHTSATNSVNNSVGAGGKEEPTCVRDLIYQAIEMSLQTPPLKPGQTGSTPGIGPPGSAGGSAGNGSVREISSNNGSHSSTTIPGMMMNSHAAVPGSHGGSSSSLQHPSGHHHHLPAGFQPQLQTRGDNIYSSSASSSHLLRPSQNSSSAVIDMRSTSSRGHSPGQPLINQQSSRQPPPEGLMMSHIRSGQQQPQSMMDEVQDLSKKSSSSSSSRESPSSRSLTPVNLRKDVGGHRPITPTIGTPVGRSPYQSSYPLPTAMPPPAHSNRHETLTPDSYHSRPPSSSAKNDTRSPSVGPIIGPGSSSSRHPSLERRTPTISGQQQQLLSAHPTGPPPLVSTASMSPKQSPKGIVSHGGQMILPPPGVGQLPPGLPPGALMYAGHRPPPPGTGYSDLLRPVGSSKDIMNLHHGKSGVHPSIQSSSAAQQQQLKTQQQQQQQQMFEHHQQQLQHAEMYRRSITNSSPLGVTRGPPGSTMMIHPPPGIAVGSADYRSFVERIHREQQKEREHQMAIDYNAAKAAAMNVSAGLPPPPSAHGGQARGVPAMDPGGGLSAQLLADFNTSKQMRRENNSSDPILDVVSTRDPSSSRKGGPPPPPHLSGHRSPAGGHRSVSPQVTSASRYTPYSMPPQTSRSSPSTGNPNQMFDRSSLPVPPTGPNYLPSVHNQGGHHDNSPNSRSPHSPYSGSPSSRYTPTLSPGQQQQRDGSRGQISPHGPGQQIRIGDRLVSVSSVPTSNAYSPYITTASGAPSIAHLPPHVQASIIQVERERMEREVRLRSSSFDSRSLTPTDRVSNIQPPSGHWTPNAKGGVIQSAMMSKQPPPQVQKPVHAPDQQQYPSYHPHKKAYMSHQSMMTSRSSPSGGGQQLSPAHGHHQHAPQPGNPLMFARGSNDAFQTLVDAAAAQQSLAVPAQQPSRHPPPPTSSASVDHHRLSLNVAGHQQPVSGHGGQMLYSALNFLGQKPPSLPPSAPSPKEVPVSRAPAGGHPSVGHLIALDKRNVNDPNEIARDRVRQIFNTESNPGHHPLPDHLRKPSGHEGNYHGQPPPSKGPQPAPIALSSRKGSPPGAPGHQSTAINLVPRPSSIAASGTTTSSADEAARLFSRSFEKDSNSLASKAPSASGFTAANLIDAIITHQINNTTPNSTPPSSLPPVGPFPGSGHVLQPTTTIASTPNSIGGPAASSQGSRPPSNVSSSGQRSTPDVASIPGSNREVPKEKERRVSIDSRDEDNCSPTDLVIDDSVSDRPPSTRDGSTCDSVTSPAAHVSGSVQSPPAKLDADGQRKETCSRKRSSTEDEERKIPSKDESSVPSSEKKRKDDEEKRSVETSSPKEGSSKEVEKETESCVSSSSASQKDGDKDSSSASKDEEKKDSKDGEQKADDEK